MHGHVHALARFRAVGMAGVTHNEDIGVAAVGCRVAVIEHRTQALANLINRPPGHFFHGQGVRLQDSLGGADQLIEADVPAVNTLPGRQLLQFNVKAHQVPPLPGDEHKCAVRR